MADNKAEKKSELEILKGRIEAMRDKLRNVPVSEVGALATEIGQAEDKLALLQYKELSSFQEAVIQKFRPVSFDALSEWMDAQKNNKREFIARTEGKTTYRVVIERVISQKK